MCARAQWNYPFYNMYNHITAGLCAGDAVVVKISEYSAWSGARYVALARRCLAACGHDPDLVQLVQGFGEAGAALVAHVDKVSARPAPPALSRCCQWGRAHVPACACVCMFARVSPRAAPLWRCAGHIHGEPRCRPPRRAHRRGHTDALRARAGGQGRRHPVRGRGPGRGAAHGPQGHLPGACGRCARVCTCLHPRRPYPH